MPTDISFSPASQFQEIWPLLLQNMHDRAIFMADTEGEILSWTPGVNHLFGYEADSFIGQSVQILFSQSDECSIPFLDSLRGVAEDGSAEVERIYIRKDGSQFWGNGPVIALRDGNEFYGFVFVLRDVSEQKQAQMRLQDSEQRLAAIFARAAVGMSEISLQGKFLRVNDELCRIMGRSREELLTIAIPEITHPDDLQPTLEGFGRLLEDNTPASLDKRYLRPDGSIVWANSSLTRIDDKQGNPSTVLAVTVDLTERHQAEVALRRAHDELEARVEERTAQLSTANEARGQLLRQVVTAQEEERRRIARELHDQLGQSLVALGLGLESLSSRLDPEAKASEMSQRLTSLHALTQGLMDQVHDLAWQLRPAELDELGLEVALRRVVNQWQYSSGIQADFLASSALNGNKPKPPIEVEVALYRVTQECLTNVSRHAGASNVGVVLKQTHHEITVIIEDDGHGFDLEAVSANEAKRLGLIGMRERLEFVGGALTIETSPGAGTTIYARVPLTKTTETST